MRERKPPSHFFEMTYNAKTKNLEISTATLEKVGYDLFYALRCIRKMSGSPMDKYKSGNILSESDHAQKAIINVADTLGIDLGAKWGNEIDLREPDEL
jgi:hypothetical protein